MYSLLFLACLSFVLAYLSTPVFRDLFRRLGYVDHPDGDRKIHREPIPRLGGIPIALAFVGSFGILLVTELAGRSTVLGGLPLAWKLLPAAGVIFVTGLLDDLLGLRPWQKFSGQTLAGVLAFYGGLQVSSVGGVALGGWLSLLITVVWIVGCSNAFNLIDGLDGLSAGIGLFATVTMLLAAWLQGNMELAIATAPLAGALIGFLRYNFNPASIFLGDSGSLLLGFLLACYGVLWSQKSATILGITAPMMVLAVPLLDTGLAIVRRFLRHQPLFEGDQGHIHHRLLARGFTPRKAALFLYGACGIAAAFSLVQLNIVNRKFAGIVIVAFCAVAFLGIRQLGYVEFGAATRLLMAGAFQRLLVGDLALQMFRQSLAQAASLDELWEAVRRGAREFGFARLEAVLLGQNYSERQASPIVPGASAGGDEAFWSTHITLPEGDYVHLARPANSPVMCFGVASFLDSLHAGLLARRAAFAEDAPLARVAAAGQTGQGESFSSVNAQPHLAAPSQAAEPGSR